MQNARCRSLLGAARITSEDIVRSCPANGVRRPPRMALCRRGERDAAGPRSRPTVARQRFESPFLTVSQAEGGRARHGVLVRSMDVVRIACWTGRRVRSRARKVRAFHRAAAIAETLPLSVRRRALLARGAPVSGRRLPPSLWALHAADWRAHARLVDITWLLRILADAGAEVKRLVDRRATGSAQTVSCMPRWHGVRSPWPERQRAPLTLVPS